MLMGVAACGPPSAALSRKAPPSGAGELVVHNYYYAKAGLADSVYRLRLRASAVRAALGLERGRVLRRIDAPDSLPDVVWEAEYADSAARAKDVGALDRSAEFREIQRTMGTLLSRFERVVWRAEPRAGSTPRSYFPPAG
ncbi:MAG: hypothetical protein NVS9B3_13660 [Gemmatimonadaceae bacterium]